MTYAYTAQRADDRNRGDIPEADWQYAPLENIVVIGDLGVIRLMAKTLAYVVIGVVMTMMMQVVVSSEAYSENYSQTFDHNATQWRIRFLDAATVAGPNVTLGEISVPAGDIPKATWDKLAATPLWPSPPEEGRAVNMTRPKLQQMVVEYLGENIARLCLYPNSLALQRGGKVLLPADIQQVVTSTLTPMFSSLPGEASLQDFRLPAYVFLSHSTQVLELEKPAKLDAGRISLKLQVRELDGTIVKKLTGTVFMDCWVEVPCASAPFNKGDLLEVRKITFMRKNIAYLRENVWDGKGGPWRIVRPITMEQVIYQNDLDNIPTVARGSIVNLLYENASVKLSATAEAMSDGVPGETIPVRNINSKKQVYATVLNGNTVVIRPAIVQASN